MTMMKRAGNKSNDLSIATVGSERLMGIPAIRLSISVFAISPLLIGRRKLIKTPTRKSRIAVKMLISAIEFRKSFQRIPRTENASRKATPERRARTSPRGVARFRCNTSRVAGMSTKRETSNNKPIPISRLTVIFAAGVLNKLFITIVLLQGTHLDWPGCQAAVPCY